MTKVIPMKCLRRNDDAMKNQCWYQEEKTKIEPGKTKKGKNQRSNLIP